MMIRSLHVAVLIGFIVTPVLGLAQNDNAVSQVWVSDRGDGTFRNPVLYADYSDPDVCRVGDDFYLTASSFNCIPGLPILHSRDLVNWKLINYALPHGLEPREVFNIPQHGKGVWAPCIRYHNDEYYIYYPDPDYGIFMVKAKDPAGEWSDPVLVKGGRGLIDPSPLWDEDGKAYLVHAFAGSRAGIKSILVVCRLNAEGTKLLDNGVMVFDGHDKHPTLEGPKFYKRNGYYYIFAPAGGVATGWQLVLRSKNVYGPYEERIVMDQGKSPVNGPHQGGWVELENGENWFLHFQDQGPYGRVVHLQPMTWKNDWPIIGEDKDNDGKGEPVLTYKKPATGKSNAIATPPDTDEFNDTAISLAWQWHANPLPYWAYPTGPAGYLRLFSFPIPASFRNLWDVPNLLLQKFPAPGFTATARLKFSPRFDGEKAGLVILGRDYSYIAVRKAGDRLMVGQAVCNGADKGAGETMQVEKTVQGNTLYLRVMVSAGAKCTFFYSEDGKQFLPLGQTFTAREGMWIGAKVGLFCLRETTTNDAGFADVDWFRITK